MLLNVKHMASVKAKTEREEKVFNAVSEVAKAGACYLVKLPLIIDIPIFIF